MKTTVLEIGISDHDKTLFSILKHTFAKEPPKLFNKEIGKNFCQKAFSSYLESNMSECPNLFEKFLQIFQDTAQLFAPLKKKIMRYNKKNYDQMP